MTRRLLLAAAGILGAMGAGLTLLLLDQIVAAIYAESGPQFLVNIIERRDVHPVTFYQELAWQRLRMPLLALTLAGTVTAVGAAIRRTTITRFGGIVDGRLGLLLTVFAVLGAVMFLIFRHGEPPLPAVVISEVVTSSANLIQDEDGDYPDWIELWNTSSETVWLDEYAIQRGSSEYWGLPRLELPPDERVIVFASGKDRTGWPADMVSWLAPSALTDASEDVHIKIAVDNHASGFVSSLTVTATSGSDLHLPAFTIRGRGAAIQMPEVNLARGKSITFPLRPDEAPHFPIHAPFRLNRDGVTLSLTGPDGFDRIRVPPLERNTSFGRAKSLELCHYYFPTPEQPNGVCLDDSLGKPELSLGSGFHNLPIEVSIQAALQDEPLFYTLDGSYPDPENNPQSTFTATESWHKLQFDPSDFPMVLANQPASIADHPGAPPIISRERNRLGTPTVDDRLLSRAVVVRARHPQSAESVGTFWTSDALHALPVFSIIADSKYLFDYESGIYHPGAIFDDWLQQKPDPARWWHVESNDFSRGRAWERPLLEDLHNAVHLEICRQAICNHFGEVGIRIHGKTSRGYAQKSLRLYARNDYGHPTFDIALFDDFPEIVDHRRLILRNSSQDSGRTMLNDGFVQYLFKNLDVETQAYQPSVLYLNGEYWGIFNLRTRYDRYYFEAEYTVASELVEFKGGNHRDFAEQLTQESNDEEALALFEKHYEVASFIDFILAGIYSANTDWLPNNVLAWRERVGESVPSDSPHGRWRWALNDYDLAPTTAGEEGAARNPFENDRTLGGPPRDAAHNGGIPAMFFRLMEAREFRDIFFARAAVWAQTDLDPSRTRGALSRHSDRISGEILNHSNRWQRFTVDEWHSSIEEMHAFLEVRPTAMLEQIADRFGVNQFHEVSIAMDSRIHGLDVGGVPLDPSEVSEEWRMHFFEGTSVQFAVDVLDSQEVSVWSVTPSGGTERQFHDATSFEVLDSGLKRFSLTLEIVGPVDIVPVFGEASSESLVVSD